MKSSHPKKYLVIRRDNIGDLVCTTPVFEALRQHEPDAYIAALVNSYNATVLDNNPYIDDVFVYTKAKHRQVGESLLSVLLKQWSLFRKLRKLKFDTVIVAGGSHLPRPLKMARQFRPKQIIGYSRKNSNLNTLISCTLDESEAEGLCETEAVFKLLETLNINPPAPSVRVWPDSQQTRHYRALLASPGDSNIPVTAIHISARKPSNRWPAERFAELMNAINTQTPTRFMLFWAPGKQNDPLHPGDDEIAQKLIELTHQLPVIPCPTHTLSELIAALSCCHQIICSDGGAMHLAAACSKPILCFFGNSDATRWRPWGVPFELIQPESHEVSDITVEQALEAYNRLVNFS